MSKLKIICLFTLMLAGKLVAGDETRSSRVYANQISPGVFIQTHDDKFTGALPWVNGFYNYTNWGMVEFGLDEDKHTIMYAKNLRATFDVAVTDINLNTVVYTNQQLNISYDPNEQTRYKDKAQISYQNAYKLKVYNIQIYSCTITTPESSPCTTAVYKGNETYLQADITTTHLYDFNFSDTFVSGDLRDTLLSNSREMQVDWNYLKGAEEYELEYTYVNDYTSTLGANLNYTAINYDLEHNSIRISTPYNQYKIPLTYESGYIVYRIRPVGRSNSNVRKDGNWFGAPASGVISDTTSFSARFLRGPLNNDALNWESVKTFAEQGKTGTGVNASDGLGYKRQSLARLNTEGKTIAQSTLYDFYGRPSINILPAPVAGLDFNYRFRLNKYNNTEFNKGDFDSSLYTSPCVATGLVLDTINSMGAPKYYSSQNPNKEGYQGYVPDAKGFPYTQVRTKPDGLGRITVQTIPGITHQLTSGKEIKYYYSKPTQVELDRLFGSEAPRATHCFKNYVLDPNGQLSTTYIDQYGRTMATALLGNSPYNVDSLSALPTSQLFTDSLITTSTNHRDTVNKCVEVNTTFFVAEPNTPQGIYYKTTLGEFGSSCLPNLCFDCLYELEISIKDECGNEMFDYDNNNGSPPGFDSLIGGNLPYVASSCNGPKTRVITGGGLSTPININFTQQGTYSLYKKICVSNAPIDDYTKEFISKQICLDPCHYVDSLIEATDFSGCSPQSCSDCTTSIASYTNYIFSPAYNDIYDHHGVLINSGYTGSISPIPTPQQISQWLENCQSFCGPTNSCEKETLKLLADFYPGTGQYAQTDTTDSRWTGSIMNPNNTLFSGYDWTSPTNYVRADGQTDYVLIGGAYVSPQNLSSTDYQLNYKKSWAQAFLTRHPEYCKLYFHCNVLGASPDYDERMKNMLHYDTVCASGFIYPTGTLPGTVVAPPNSSCGSPSADPIFTSLSSNAAVIALKHQLLNNMYGNTSQSIYNYVASQFYSPIPPGYKFGQDECTRDLMWDMFKTIYLTKKQGVYESLYNAYMLNPTAYGLPGGISCPATAPTGYTSHFQNWADTVIKGVSGGMSFINTLISTNNADSAAAFGASIISAINATLSTHTATNCAAYTSLWNMNLNTACPAYSSAGSVLQNKILDALVGVCINGSNASNPDGGSTVVSGNPFLIMPGSVPVNSFQDVLDFYLDTNVCFSGVISQPPPYPYNTSGLAGPDGLKSCQCNQVLQNAADFQTLSASSSLPPGVTQEWQLFRYSHGFDLKEYYTLKCFCNNAVNSSVANSPWTSGLVWNNTQVTALAAYPMPVSTDLKCEEACVKCSDAVTAINNLVLPASSPFSNKLDKILNDSVNSYYSLAMLNSQFGNHSLRYYFDLYEDCESFNSSGASAYTFSNLITSQALDLFGYLNQLVKKGNLQKNSRPLSICQDDKYYLSGIYGGTLPTINNLTYNYNVVGSTLTFMIQAAGPTNVLVVALTLPGSYGGTWADLKQLSNFVAWCPTPVAGPNYGFKVTGTDASYNMVVIDGQITNAAFPISHLSSAPNPVPALCPETPKKQNSCAVALINNALTAGQLLFDQQAESLAATFQKQYKKYCFESLKEMFYRKYKFTREYNYTLYYYDEAGNLQRTVAPEGVSPLSITTDLPASPVSYPLHSLGTSIVNQRYVSDYRYNAYNQPVKEKTVDGGETNYMYDPTGRILASQNAKQAAVPGNYVYSYTLYDAIGRITEVGEMLTSTNLFGTANVNSMTYSSFEAVVAAASRRQVSRTYYDSYSNTPASTNALLYFALPDHALNNLRNRVACVTYVETLAGSSYEHATWYSYDDHGNVEFLVQENNLLSSALAGASSGYNMQFKRLDYKYDLISGNMVQASYQQNQADQLSHKYYYDADNRLHEVFTSKDDVNWDRDAKYFYYEHGPLARIERAEKKVQGTDYYYTIHGWLKGVNSDMMEINRDAGKDGAATTAYLSNYDKIHAYFAKDAMSFALNYYNNTSVLASNRDYRAIKNDSYNTTTNLSPASDLSNLYNNTAPLYLDNLGAGDGPSLFNGNISSMVTSFIDKDPTNSITNNTPFPQLTAYRYDQLHRITSQKAHRSHNGNVWNAAVNGTNYYSAYRMQLSYDKNGNLQQLTRNGADPALKPGASLSMDTLIYRYKTIGNGATVNSNQLYGIYDWAGGSTYTDDVDAPPFPLPYSGTSDRYAYDETGNLIKDAGEYIGQIVWTVDRKVQSIIRDAAAMLLTGTGVNSVYKPDIEYEYNAMRQRVTKIVKPRDQVTKAIKPETFWKYTYYVYDASGNVMAVYDRTTTTGDPSKVAISLSEHHIYGSQRLALTRPSSPIEWSYHYTLCGGGENPDCRTLITTNVPGHNVYSSSRYLGFKEFELPNHLGNVIATVSDRKTPEISGTVDDFDFNNYCNWGGTGVTNSSGWLALTTSAAYNAMEKYINTEVGKSYRIIYKLYNPDALAVEGEAYPVPVSGPFLVNVPAPATPATTTNEFIFTATTTQTRLRIQRGFDAAGYKTFFVDSVRIQEITNYAPDQLMHTDYYAFGQQMPGRTWVASDYRYGMNGQEKQDEVFKGANSAEYWMYDSRIGRRWEIDPVVYPWRSGYSTFNNNPIFFCDPSGLVAEEGESGTGTSGNTNPSGPPTRKDGENAFIEGHQGSPENPNDLNDVVVKPNNPGVDDIKKANEGVKEAVYKVSLPEGKKEIYDPAYDIWSYDGTTKKPGTDPNSIFRNVVTYGANPNSQGGVNYSNIKIEPELIGKITKSERSTNYNYAGVKITKNESNYVNKEVNKFISVIQKGLVKNQGVTAAYVELNVGSNSDANHNKVAFKREVEKNLNKQFGTNTIKIIWSDTAGESLDKEKKEGNMYYKEGKSNTFKISFEISTVEPD